LNGPTRIDAANTSVYQLSASTTAVNIGGAANLTVDNDAIVTGAIESASISFDGGINSLSSFVDKTAWSPSISGLVNFAGVSTSSGYYMRFGSLVIAQVRVSGTVTWANLNTSYTFTLPVAQSAGTALVGGNGYVYYTGTATRDSNFVIQDNSGATTNVGAAIWKGPSTNSQACDTHVYCQYMI